MVLLARELAYEGRWLFPNDKRVKHFAIVLAPAKVIGTEPASDIGLEASHRWFQDSPAKMIMDTGAPWCILDPELAETWDLASDANDAPITNLNIRGEVRWGRLIRINIILRATHGENLKVEATFFVPFLDPDEAWNYPNFLGLSGFLDRFRYAVDASENAFYFGR
jgi:hypothetical protein